MRACCAGGGGGGEADAHAHAVVAAGAAEVAADYLRCGGLEGVPMDVCLRLMAWVASVAGKIDDEIDAICPRRAPGTSDSSLRRGGGSVLSAADANRTI